MRSLDSMLFDNTLCKECGDVIPSDEIFCSDECCITFEEREMNKDRAKRQFTDKNKLFHEEILNLDRRIEYVEKWIYTLQKFRNKIKLKGK